jgi:hypothetical protein
MERPRGAIALFALAAAVRGLRVAPIPPTLLASAKRPRIHQSRTRTVENIFPSQRNDAMQSDDLPSDWDDDEFSAFSTTIPIQKSQTAPFLRWLDSRLERWRRRNRPKRIILVRHGQSVGNVDNTSYAKTPDSKISLTTSGFAQGAACGVQLRKLVGNETTAFCHSPYIRARQTLLSILLAFEGTDVEISSEPRLREQDFGASFAPHWTLPAFRAMPRAPSLCRHPSSSLTRAPSPTLSLRRR